MYHDTRSLLDTLLLDPNGHTIACAIDFVFQRNYTALNVGELVPDNLGFLELRTDEDAFFRLLIEGHSLTDNLELNVTYAESGNMTSVTGEVSHYFKNQRKRYGCPFIFVQLRFCDFLT